MRRLTEAVAFAVIVIVIILACQTLVPETEAQDTWGGKSGAFEVEPKRTQQCTPLPPANSPYVLQHFMARRSELMDAVLVVGSASYLDLVQIVPMTDEPGCYALIYWVNDPE